MQVKIRYAKTEDFSQLKDIWLRCFNDSKEFIDLFFSYKGYCRLYGFKAFGIHLWRCFFQIG